MLQVSLTNQAAGGSIRSRRNGVRRKNGDVNQRDFYQNQLSVWHGLS